jgi:hypothetical protein
MEESKAFGGDIFPYWTFIRPLDEGECSDDFRLPLVFSPLCTRGQNIIKKSDNCTEGQRTAKKNEVAPRYSKGEDVLKDSRTVKKSDIYCIQRTAKKNEDGPKGRKGEEEVLKDRRTEKKNDRCTEGQKDSKEE